LNDRKETIDFSKEKIDPQTIIEPPFEEKPYDPKPQEDKARRWIAFILLFILGTIVIWTLILVTVNPTYLDTVSKLLQIILGPVIALVSAATGFYFGSKAK
jgi:hypothetical protein